MASNYFYNSQSLGRPKRQTFSVYSENNLQQQQQRKPFRPISNVFDYNHDPSNSASFVDGPTSPGSYYLDLNSGANRKLTRHLSTLNPPVRHHQTHQPYKPDPPVINPAFLDGSVLRPKILVDERGFVIDDGDDDEFTQTPPPPSMTSNHNRPYPQFEHSSLNQTSAIQPNFHSHLTKNVQTQLSRLSAPVNPSDPSLQFLTLPRSLNPTNRHSNSSSDSSSTLVSSAGSSLHYHSGSDMSSAPNVASLSSSLYYVDCSANGERNGPGTHHSGSNGDSNRSSICSSSTITQSSIGSYQMGDPDALPPPPPDLVNQHELLDSLPLPPPPPQHEHYNRPLSPAPPPPVSIVSLTTTPNRSYLDQPLPPPPNHEIVTTLRRKHFSLATDDSPYHYPMSTFTNTGTLTNRRRPAPPPPPSRAPHVGPVGTKVTSSSPSPSKSSSSGISDSSSRSSGSSSHCSPSSMSTSFTSTSTYEQPKVMSSPSKPSILHSPDYMSPMLIDPPGAPETEEVTFNKRKSSSPTYGWVYQAPQSPTTNSEDNLTSSTNSTHVHLDTFSMSDPGSRFTTMDRNNNSKNNQQPQPQLTTYEYSNSAFVNDNRGHDDNRIKAKLNNPSYTLFLDDPSVRETSVDGGSVLDRPNDQLLGPNKQSKRSPPSGCSCCVRVTRCFVMFVCVLLLCFMLGVIGFTLYGRYNHGDRDGLSFWRRFFPLGSVVNYNSTISSETATSFLPSTSVMSTISTTLAPITLITTILKTSNQSELSKLSPFQSTPLFNQSESRPESKNQSNVSSILSTIKPESTPTSSSVNQSEFTTPYSTPSLYINPIKLNEPTFNTNNSPSKRFKSDSIDSSNDSFTPSTTILPFDSSTNPTIITSQINAQIDNSTQTITNESVATTTEQPNLHQPSTFSPSVDITTNFPVPPTLNMTDIVTSSTSSPNITPSANDTQINSNSSKGATKIFDDFIIHDQNTPTTISTLTTPSPLFIISDNNNMNETRDSRNMEDGNGDGHDYTTTSNPVNGSSINTESTPEDESPDVINTDLLDSFIDDIFGDDNQTTTLEPQDTSLNKIRVNTTSTTESPEIASLTIPNHNSESNVLPKNSKSVSEISSVDTQPNITEIDSVPETTTTRTTFTTIAEFNPEYISSLLTTTTKNSKNVVSTESFNPTTTPSAIAES